MTGANGTAAATCLLCKGRISLLHRFGERSVCYCPSCEFGQLDPLPTEDELRRLYGSREYFEGSDRVGYAGYAQDAPQFARTFRHKVRDLLACTPVRDLLEIGCGPGYFLAAAEEAGIANAVGIDLNPAAIEAARAAGHRAEVGAIEQVEADRKYDAIVMFDVLEHITAPVPFLTSVRGHTREGGVLYLMTPNIRSLLARVSGRRWVSFKIPEHVAYYSPRSIRLLLESAGWEVVSVRPTGQYVTLDFLLSRVERLLAPAALLRGMARRLRCDGLVLFVPNGSIDVIARLRGTAR